MRDLFRFVLRGAWPGVAFSMGLMIMIWGSLGAFIFLHPLYLAYALTPGAITGIVIWFVAGKANKPLTAGVRFAIGSGVIAGFLLMMSIYQMAVTMNVTLLEYIDLPSLIMRIAVFGMGIGGLGGLACPGARQYLNRKSNLTYRERTRLYEAAEEEARTARQRNASARVITHTSGLTV
jgi:hypothetical protein